METSSADRTEPVTSTQAHEQAPLKGEGDAEYVVRIRMRRGCDNCGKPATYRNTYLMPRARSNPASKAYGRDDCSWCSDHDQHLCGDCHAKNRSVGVPDGYGWCATFGIGDRFAHMFLEWRERKFPSLTALWNFPDSQAHGKRSRTEERCTGTGLLVPKPQLGTREE